MEQEFLFQLQNIFKQFCEKLDETRIECLLYKLNGLFNNGYQNTYSDCYDIIKSIMENTSEREYVFDNLERSADKAQTMQLDHTDKIKKLFDYFSLELKRYIDVMPQLDDFKRRSKDLINDQIENLQIDAQDIQSEIKESSSRSITILSIFAGIALAFTGGISLLSDAIASLSHKISSYKLIMTLSLTGFVLYNLIISLMFIIARLNKNDIGVRCKYGFECSSCGRKSPIHLLVCQSMNKYPYIFSVNIVLLYIIYTDFILWLYSSNNKEVFSTLFHTGILSGDLIQIIFILLPGIVYLFRKGFLTFKNILKKNIFSRNNLQP